MPLVLITGANRGIGLELARQYAEDGWDVVATCRDPDRAGELREIAKRTGTVEVPGSAAGVRRVIDELTMETTGSFTSYTGKPIHW
jgi:NAD(P)-dependent dehydrogenase (short-subunit alcohol dehydrogenase family)